MRLRALLRSLPALYLGLVLLWAGTYALPAQAQPGDTPDSQIYDFGLHLFHLGDYYRAITEFKRFSLLFPQHARQPMAELLIGLALQEDTATEEAFTHFQRWRLADDPTDTTRVAAFKLGELRFLQGQYRQAIEHWQGFLDAFPTGPLVSHTKYLLGLSWTLDGQLAQGQQVFATLPARDPLAQQAMALQEDLRLQALPVPKSSRVAGILSGVLPGAGHLYAGKPWQALTAFVLNGVFLGGAAYALHEGLEVSAAILLFFETGWYLGGINSAMEATRAANRTQQQAWADHLRTTYAPPTLTLRALHAPALGLRLRF